MGALKVFKKIVFVWGFMTLILVLFITAYVVIELGSTPPRAPRADHILYESDIAPFHVLVKRIWVQDAGNTVISINRPGEPVLSEYSLPTGDYGIDHLQVDDIQIIPVGEDRYRIILHSAFYECDEASSNYIWFFNLNEDRMALVQMVDLSEMHRTDGDKNIIWGYKHVSLPYVEDLGYEHFTIPVEVRVADSIVISPMLNRDSMDMLKENITGMAARRLEVLARTAPDDKDEKAQECNKAVEEIEKIATKKVIPF